MEIFVEQDQIAPVRIDGPARVAAMAGTAAVVVRQKNSCQAAGQLPGDFTQCQPLSGTGRTLGFEMVSVEMVIAFQRFDQEVVGRKPDGPAPVGIAAKEGGVRFARHIFQTMHFAAGVKFERMFLVELGQRPNSIGREEFIFIEHVA